MSRLTLATVLVVAGGLCLPAVGQGLVVRREADGVQASTQTGVTLTTNSFDAATPGAYLTSAGLPGVSTGTYTAGGNGFGVFNDVYGGTANSNYFSTGGRAAPGGGPLLSPSVSLSLGVPVGYFGLYWTAVDSPNRLEFYRGGTLIDAVTADRLLADPGLAGTAYNGSAAAGQTTAEKFVFVNVYAPDAAHLFDQVVFTNVSSGSGFESDTHTFATVLIPDAQQAGVSVPVPEPVGLVAVGAGLLAGWRFRVRRVGG